MSKRKWSFWRLTRIFLLACGSLFIVLCVLAFTTVPFYAYHALADDGRKHDPAPGLIVMLSGAGIPSENGLMRAYFTAWLAGAYPGAQVFIAAPGELSDSLGDPHRIAGELMLRGVAEERILFAASGKNTRSQALEIAAMIPDGEKSRPLTIVSSPEHIRRSVLCFKKCGFSNVSGFPAFESSLQTSLQFEDNDLRGNKLAPPIGSNLQVRYQFWNHLKYEVIVLREYIAIAYYKLRGWI